MMHAPLSALTFWVGTMRWLDVDVPVGGRQEAIPEKRRAFYEGIPARSGYAGSHLDLAALDSAR